MNKKIKCIVFDLDNTLWDGILLEDGDGVRIKKGVRETLSELDRRGILMSVASKNDYSHAMKKLEAEGIAHYFLVPQISWSPKSESIETISKLLNLSTKEFAFMDDQSFERDEVLFAHPDISVYDEVSMERLCSLEEFTPRFITEDSKLRRSLYENDLKRQADEKEFIGTSEEFLKTLDLHLTVSRVTHGDLERVEELTLRTHQLNSTGRTFSYEELSELISDPRYIFLIASLENKYGNAGKVGLILLEKGEDSLTIKLLIMSCRVMSLGIGSVMLRLVAALAQKSSKKLLADFVFTDRNRIMYITYKMHGFEDDSDDDAKETVLVHDGECRPIPDYFRITDNTEAFYD